MNARIHEKTALKLEEQLDKGELETPQVIQLHKNSGDVAIPKQTEHYDAEEGKDFLLKFIGRMCEAAHRDGISKEQVDRWHAYAVEGLT